MPGWHAKTQGLQEAGKLRLLGIVEEQHPDRARLFMQWQSMDWPLLVDSLNLLEVAAVPITLLIDEHGIIRKIGPNEVEVKEFVDRDFDPPGEGVIPAGHPDLDRLQAVAETGDANADGWRTYANALVRWGGEDRLGDAISAYQKAIQLESRDGPTHFRLGVAYRKRYDARHRIEGDFARAVEAWGDALAIDPNQYIWRRRIQQYGPRLDKPYPFYDWVTTAQDEIRQRGEEPVPLIVEPSGAEIAAPSKTIGRTGDVSENPDPNGRIERDGEGFVAIEATVVPATAGDGQAVRVHLVFRPNETIKAHWNNEAEDLAVWIDPPNGWTLDSRYYTVPTPPVPVEAEPRRVEFELKTDRDDADGTATVRGYALYYVCEDANGVCVFRRQDFEVPVTVKGDR